MLIYVAWFCVPFQKNYSNFFLEIELRFCNFVTKRKRLFKRLRNSRKISLSNVYLYSGTCKLSDKLLVCFVDVVCMYCMVDRKQPIFKQKVSLVVRRCALKLCICVQNAEFFLFLCYLRNLKATLFSTGYLILFNHVSTAWMF